MHDPKTLAFEIYLGKKKNKKGHYRTPLIQIWHEDPCVKGDDDSCGFFLRLKHADKNVYEKIVKGFEFEWDRIYTSETKNKYDEYVTYNRGWFSPEGDNILSVQGIVFNMYLYASKIVFNPYDKISPEKAWKLSWKFMNKNHIHITYFAENNVDSMKDIILRTFQRGCDIEYTSEKRMEMIRECAEIVYMDILRRTRKWYQHPRWHIHHWRISFPFLRTLKRRYIDKCYVCGKGFKNSDIHSDWDGTKLWHGKCYNNHVKQQN